MGYKDLHDKPFDEGTIAKLEIFEDYAQAWIPTFVMSGRASTICIFDFFAGTGYDKNGVEGSPIRILNKIKEQAGNIFQKKVNLKVFLNEYNKEKFKLLKASCEKYLEDNKEVRRAIDIEYHSKNFVDLFPKLLNEIKANPSLVFLDQNGIKFLSSKYFLELEKTTTTDFLYFLSASYIWRFGNTEEFKVHLNIDLEAAKENPFKLIHRSILEQLKLQLPEGSQLKLYPYSIKKGSSIYGIIFGAKHPLAVDKFLNIAWGRNSINGEADYDLDDDLGKQQLPLFGEKKLTKMEKFDRQFREQILSKSIKNNSDALVFAHGEGHIARHAADTLRKMKREGLITYEATSPCVTYDNVHKKYNIVSYHIKNG